jgi:hypothetical protein
VRDSDRNRSIRALFHKIDSQGKEWVSVELGGDALAIAKGNLAYLQLMALTTSNFYNSHKFLSWCITIATQVRSPFGVRFSVT